MAIEQRQAALDGIQHAVEAYYTKHGNGAYMWALRNKICEDLGVTTDKATEYIKTLLETKQIRLSNGLLYPASE